MWHLLDSSDFPARWHCGHWTLLHGWTHIASDLAIGAAYAAIPAVLAYFVLRRRDVPFQNVFWLFVAFILSCGTGHVMEAVIFWLPIYRLAAAVKVLTAVVSWLTVLALIPMLPRALALPGLSSVNRRLESEIADRKRAERRFRILFESALNGMIMVDQSGRIVLANRQAEQVFGYEPGELLGNLVETLVPERHRGHHAQFRGSYLARPEPRAMGVGRELYGQRKDGTEFPVEIGLTPIETEEGSFIVGVITDITERVRSQDNLRKSEEQFRLVWENAVDGMRLSSADGTVVAVNGAYCRMVGKSRGDLEGRQMATVYADFHRQQVMRRYQESFAQRSVRAFTGRRMELWDGRFVWLEVTSCFVETDSSRPLLLSIFRDVTARKQTERMLQLAQFSMDRAVDSVFWVSPTGTILYANDMTCRTLNECRDALIGKPVSEVATPLPEEIWPQNWESLKRRGSLTIDATFAGPDGRLMTTEVTLNYLKFEDQEYNCVIIHDISERKKAMEIHQAHSHVLLSMSEGVCFVDENNKIQFTNHALDHMFGYRGGELVGQPVTVLNDLTVQENDRVAAKILAALSDDRVWEGEFRNRRKDGSVFWSAARISAVNIFGERRFVSVQKDITARKVAEEQMALLRDQLAHAARIGTLGELTCGLAHELNQPLAALHLYADTALKLGEELCSAEIKECLHQISKESLRAGEIVRRMRAFAAPASPRRMSVDINQLIQEVLLILAVELRRHEVVVNLVLADDLSKVLADSIQIQQVLVNLIRNALDSMIAATACDRMIAIQSRAVPEGVFVQVSDKGGGIDASLANKLFQPFQTTKPTGLGLGLAICRTLIEAHGGRIGVEPNGDGGTTFYFLLPTNCGAADLTDARSA